MRILIDADIYLDAALRREPFWTDSVKVLDAAARPDVQVFITATSVVNIFYILRKDLGTKPALRFLQDTFAGESVGLLPVDKNVIDAALTSSMSDFEDAVQAAAADFSKMDFIVTRNVKDYRYSPVKAVVPEEILFTLGEQL